VKMRLGELADKLDLVLDGDPDCLIEGISTLTNSRANTVSFLANPRYRTALENTSAAAVIVREADRDFCPVNALISRNPYLSYAHLSALFAPNLSSEQAIHPSASIHPGAKLANHVRIGANAVIEDGVELAAGVEIGAGSVVQQACYIGAYSRLMANVTIYHHCRIGERVLIHSGSVIGSDGFGFTRDQDRWVKIHQLGRVLIGNDVEIGSNTSIDRGAIDDTVIGDNVIIDNLVHIAHNVSVGSGTAIAGCVGIAGSVEIGENCTFAGGVGVAGHLQIAPASTLLAMTMVTHSLKHPGVYASGIPADEQKIWQKNAVRFRQLNDMARRLRALEKALLPSS